MGVGVGVMSTIEVMDGFSEEWGFSLGDIGFNLEVDVRDGRL